MNCAPFETGLSSNEADRLWAEEAAEVLPGTHHATRARAREALALG